MILSYKIHTVTPYINWIYFFHAWGFQPRFAAIANIHGCDACRASWLTTFPEEERSKASEAMQLFKEANRMLDLLDRDYEVKTLFKLCKANADGDNLIIEKEKDQFVTFPLLRQQTPKRDGSPFLCLSDFIRPLSSASPTPSVLLLLLLMRTWKDCMNRIHINTYLSKPSPTDWQKLQQKRCMSMYEKKHGDMPKKKIWA